MCIVSRLFASVSSTYVYQSVPMLQLTLSAVYLYYSVWARYSRSPPSVIVSIFLCYNACLPLLQCLSALVTASSLCYSVCLPLL